MAIGCQLKGVAAHLKQSTYSMTESFQNNFSMNQFMHRSYKRKHFKDLQICMFGCDRIGEFNNDLFIYMLSSVAKLLILFKRSHAKNAEDF